MCSETHQFGKWCDSDTLCMFCLTRPYSKSERMRANPFESARIYTNPYESEAKPSTNLSGICKLVYMSSVLFSSGRSPDTVHSRALFYYPKDFHHGLCTPLLQCGLDSERTPRGRVIRSGQQAGGRADDSRAGILGIPGGSLLLFF